MDGAKLRWTKANENESAWLEDEDNAWEAVVLTKVEKESVHAKRLQGGTVEELSIGSDGLLTGKRLLPRDVGPKSKGLRNMDDLTHLHEASILHNVCVRFQDKLIYTRTGPILVAMNPFEWLPIYGSDTMSKYQNASNLLLEEMEPHCFAEAERAYRKLKHEKHSQSLIICGESGAGKTETTKLMLQYLSHNYTGETEKGISDRIMKSNPVMEAFGNAKTLRNNNSSRFGKFIRLKFDQDQVRGAHVSNYLLEKSRTVRQSKGERNYHIFYQVCKGASAKVQQQLALTSDSIRDFFYLNQSDCFQVDGVNDAEEFSQTTLAMESVGMNQQEIDTILHIIAAILHLGNVTFGKPEERSGSAIGEQEEEKGQDGEQESLPQKDIHPALKIAANLLQCNASQLSHALGVKYISVGGKSIESPLNVGKAQDLRDALSKTIYAELFNYIVSRINESLTTGQENSTELDFIGILDIYGFESFQVNGFEQLLINFANEKLQSLFNEQVFQAEEETYRLEQVPFSRTDLPNNEKCLSMVNGIFKLMHDECLKMDAGSDKGLVSQISNQFRSEPHFIVCGPGTKRKGTSDLDFAIRHYAGEIVYTCEAFVDKNRDTLYPHVRSILSASESPLVQKLFPSQAPVKGKLQETVAKRFSQQVHSLTETIQGTGPIFVRCIKTNNKLVPNQVDRPSILRQLKNAGVVAALEMRRAGFPNRLLYKDFVLRCRALVPASKIQQGSWEDLAKYLLTEGHLVQCKDGVAFGKTKLFLRANVLHQIDGIIQQHITEYVVAVQCIVRQFLLCKKFQLRRQWTILMQARFRGRRDRRKFQKQIQELEEKRKWIQREGVFRSLNAQVNEADKTLTKLANSVTCDAQSSLLQLPGLERNLARVLTLQSELQVVFHLKHNDLDEVDALLAQFEATVQACQESERTVLRNRDNLRARISAIQDQESLCLGKLSDLAEKEAAQHDFFSKSSRSRRSSSPGIFFLRRAKTPPSEETRQHSIEIIVDRFCAGYIDTKQSVKEMLEAAGKSVTTYDLDDAENQLKQALDFAEEAERRLAFAVSRKREIEKESKRLKARVRATQRMYVKAMARFFENQDLSQLTQVETCQEEADAQLSTLLDSISPENEKDFATTKLHHLQRLARDSGFWCDNLGDSEAGSDEETKSGSEVDARSEQEEEEEEEEDSFEVYDVDDLKEKLETTVQTIQALDEVLGRARILMDGRSNAISHVRKAKRTCSQRLERVQREYEDLFTEDQVAVLFEHSSAQKSWKHAQVWLERCSFAEGKSLVDLAMDEEDIEKETEDIEKCATETVVRTEKAATSIEEAMKRLLDVQQIQAKMRKTLLPAVDDLNRLQEVAKEHGLHNRRDIQEAIDCVGREIEEARRFLDFREGDPFPSKTFGARLESAVTNAVSVLETGQTFVAEQIENQRRVIAKMDSCKVTLAKIASRQGALEAKIEHHWVFQQKSLRSLCKASFCSSAVCAAANELAKTLENVGFALSRASRKLAQIDTLFLSRADSPSDLVSEREELVLQVERISQRCEADSDRAELLLTQLVSLREKELELIESNLNRKCEMEGRLAMAQGMLETFSTSRREDVFYTSSRKLVEACRDLLCKYEDGIRLVHEEEPDPVCGDLGATVNKVEDLYEDSIKVMMFVRREPFKVLETIHQDLSKTLEDLEQNLATERSFLAKREQMVMEERVRRTVAELEREREARAQQETFEVVRRMVLEKLTPCRRLVAAVAKAYSHCEESGDKTLFGERSILAISQLVKVQHCLTMVERALEEQNVQLVQEQAQVTELESNILQGILFEENSSGASWVANQGKLTKAKFPVVSDALLEAMQSQCRDVVDKMSVSFTSDAWTLSETADILDLERHKVRAIKAEMELFNLRGRVSQQALADWDIQGLLEEAESSLVSAHDKLMRITAFPSSSFVLLQCLDRPETLGSDAAGGLQEIVWSLKASLAHAKASVNKLSVAFDRCQRDAEKRPARDAKAKRLVLRYVCK